MVEEFNEFSAIVTNPVERLSIKQFVKTHSSSTIHSNSELIPSVSHMYKDIPDDMVILYFII